MPHKHTRTTNARHKDGKDYDLPPSSIARPLPVGKASKQNSRRKPNQQNSANGSNPYYQDDTPRDFARLMDLKKTGKRLSGLDDGPRSGSKKRKLAESESHEAEERAKPTELPTILPGERMSEFSARVNQALPIAGVKRKGVKQPGLKERQTKTEKKMQKMQADWRNDESKRQEKEQDAADLEDEKDAEQWHVGARSVGRIGSGKDTGENVEKDDPWAVIKAKRVQPGGLHDVAQAPPTFKKLPTDKFKVRNGAMVNVDSVPASSGSLRQREELGENRRSIIESYRQMMRDQRGSKP